MAAGEAGGDEAGGIVVDVLAMEYLSWARWQRRSWSLKLARREIGVESEDLECPVER